MRDKNENNFIELDKETQVDLKTLIQSVNELQIRMQIIVSTYVRVSKKKGNYRISRDFTKLELVKEPKTEKPIIEDLK